MKGHIPDNKVKLAAMSGRFKEVLEAVEDLGVKVIEIPSVSTLPPPISSHSDMLIHPIGEGSVFLAKELEFMKDEFNRCGVEVKVLKDMLGDRYPLDCQLNFFTVKNSVIGNIAHINKDILDYYANNGYKNFECRQGYTKCSTLLLSEEAAITTDVTICNLLTSFGVDCLYINGEDILLPGYKSGFIGGASFMLDRSTVVFTGCLATHIQGREVVDFLNKRKFTYIELTDKKLLDIGGVILLK